VAVAVFDRLGASARLAVTPGAGHGIGPEAIASMRGHLNV